MPVWLGLIVNESTATPRTATVYSHRSKYRASRDAEARLLLLIDAFSRTKDGPRTLEGRVKLAKLDFLVRYPRHLASVLSSRGKGNLTTHENLIEQDSPLESRMVRYRYGPWDPSHYAILGSLVGRGLIEIVPAAGTHALGYRTTERGTKLVGSLLDDGSFEELQGRIVLLRRHLDLTGETLKRVLYDLPEVANASWHEELT